RPGQREGARGDRRPGVRVRRGRGRRGHGDRAGRRAGHAAGPAGGGRGGRAARRGAVDPGSHPRSRRYRRDHERPWRGYGGGDAHTSGYGVGMTRVMVVDDHPMWRDAVARDLTEAGYEVVATTGEGRQALRAAQAVQPEVVVLDLQLPDLPGVEVARGLAASGRPP